MKYTIHGLQQDKLIDLGLNNDDALILSVLKDRYASMKMEYKIINGQRFIWVNYENLLHDIPIIFNAIDNIDSSKKKLSRKLKKYEDLGLIIKKIQYEKLNIMKNKNEHGTFSYICLSLKFDYLTEYEKEPSKVHEKVGVDIDVQGGRNKMSKGGGHRCPTKDSSFIDYPTIDNTTTEIPEVKENKEVKEKAVVVDTLIVKFNKKYGGNLDHNLLKNLIKIKGYDVVEKCIDEFENYIINANQVEKVFYDFCMKHDTDKAYKKNTAYKSNTVNNQPIQSTNYNQREYDDDFFNSLYKNYEYVKDEL